MKKYLSIIVIVSVLFAGVSFAHASGISWANVRKPVDTTLGTLTNQTTGVLNGVDVEFDTYTNASSVVTTKTIVVSKSYYQSDIAQAQARIAKLQTRIVKDQTLEAQLPS